MSFNQGAATYRHDIRTVVLEGSSIDSLFIGLNVFPEYPSPVRVGQYPKFKLGTGEIANNDAAKRSPAGTYQRTSRSYEQDTFTCLEYGLEEVVDDSNARDFSMYFESEVIAASQVYRQLRIAHELRVASAVMNTANFTSTAASVNYTEANLATIAFHLDVLNARERLLGKGIVPNAIVMSSAVWARVRRSTLAQGFIRGAGKSTDATLMITPEMLSQSFAADGLSQVFVGGLSYNSAKKGQAFSATPAWGNTYIWVGKVASGDFSTGGAGRTISWVEEGGTFIAETYRDEERRSNVVRARHTVAEKVIDPTCGELITTSYS